MTFNLFNIFSSNLTLEVARISESAKLPRKAHTGYFEDAAFDLFTTETKRVGKGMTEVFSTGIKVIIPDGYWLKFHERSGLAAKRGIHIHGGVIDSGYTGELKVIVHNSSNDDQFFAAGDAICQFTMEKVTPVKIEEIPPEVFSVEEQLRERGEAGFGSTNSKA